MQQVPGLPSPPAYPAWRARQTWLCPAPSRHRCSPGDQLGAADSETKYSELGLHVCGRKCASELCRLVYGLITDLAIPQVAHRAGLEQEDVVGVERRGPRRHFSGLGVELVSPPHLEEPGVPFGADPAGSVCTPLTDRNRIMITGAFSPKLTFVLRKKSNLKDDEFSFKNGQEVSGLLSHDHPDLHRSSIVLFIKVDGLIGAGCDLICGGMSALMLDTCSDTHFLIHVTQQRRAPRMKRTSSAILFGCNTGSC